MEAESQISDQELLSKIVAQGDHIVLVGLSGIVSSWLRRIVPSCSCIFSLLHTLSLRKRAEEAGGQGGIEGDECVHHAHRPAPHAAHNEALNPKKTATGYVFKTMMRMTQHLTSPELPGPLRTVPIVVLYSTAAHASAHFVKFFAKVLT